MGKLILMDEAYAIVGAAMEVHRDQGCGFSEPVYQECMEIELAARRIPFVAQKELHISYKGYPLRKTYIVDFVVFDKIIVELKALDQLTSREEAQVLNQLKASGLELALLVNFGASSLEWKRLVWTHGGGRTVSAKVPPIVS
jgi:GxxExxY protein